MSKIILQPVANKLAHEHFERTLLNPVSTNVIEKHVDEEIFNKIKLQYPDNKVYIWGIKNGKNDTNKKKWEKIARGDIVLFSKEGAVFACAIITMMFRNRSLAVELWGTDQDDSAWENIYLVDEIQNITIPYAKLNSILGYRRNNIIQGFTVLNNEKSEKVDIKFELSDVNICEEVTEKDYTDLVVRLADGEMLDIQGHAIKRKEQGFLRKYLFRGKKEFVCGICGRKLPTNMLITSHIKKRSECSKEEKLDYKHIVMPMCKFGCDDLYEKGYIYIQDGKVKINNKKWMTDDMRNELRKLEGKNCPYYNKRTKPYFEAHNRKFGI